MSDSEKRVHEVNFYTYPKLLFVWPIILAGLLFYPLAPSDAALGLPDRPDVGDVNAPQTESETEGDGAATADGDVMRLASFAQDAPAADGGAAATEPETDEAAERLAWAAYRAEWLGWVYLWIVVVVLLAIGVDIDRNMAIFWVVLVALVIVLGLWLRDTRQFTLFGEIYRWFDNLDVRYSRNLGLAMSLILLVPYLLMLLWARFNSRWRITHNEFEHYCFGKMDDSLGRGAKTIRTDFPDMFEFLLGFGAGTLIVYNAIGTRELRRIPHVMLLPLVRQKLNKILETTSVTAAQLEEEEDEDL